MTVPIMYEDTIAFGEEEQHIPKGPICLLRP